MKIEYVNYRPLMTPRPLGYGDMAVFETPHRRRGHEPPFIEVITGEADTYDPAGDTFFVMRLLNEAGRPDSVEMMQGALVLHGASRRDRIIYEYLMMHDANEHKRGRNERVPVRYGLTKVVMDGDIIPEDEYDERLWSFYRPVAEEEAMDVTEAVTLTAEESEGSVLLDEEQMSKVEPLVKNVKGRFMQKLVRYLIEKRRLRLVKDGDGDDYRLQIRHFRTMTFVTIGRISNTEGWGDRLARQLVDADEKGIEGKEMVSRILVKNADAVYAVCKQEKRLYSLERVIATWPDLYEVMVKNSAHGVG